nr:MAG TPA: hypothetical protein [Caudoviricetes sp.]
MIAFKRKKTPQRIRCFLEILHHYHLKWITEVT